MDIKVTKGLASVGNEELRDWTEKGWNQAMREGNYDRSREHLNFEIHPGGIVAPIDKSRPLTRRMAENLASRGIKDPNEGLAEPRFRTVVNFISAVQRNACESLPLAIRRWILKARVVTSISVECQK